MRNTDYLDNEQPEDRFIGELFYDEENRPCRMINGRKIYQLEQTTENIDLELIINRSRVNESNVC